MLSLLYRGFRQLRFIVIYLPYPLPKQMNRLIAIALIISSPLINNRIYNEKFLEEIEMKTKEINRLGYLYNRW